MMLDPGAIKASARLYLGEANPNTPLASPLFADLNGLPPLLIQVGSDECILSDSTMFAEAAEAVGVEVTLEVWQGMQHEWHFAAEMLPEGRQAVNRIGEFILESVGVRLFNRIRNTHAAQ
jgi:acetyl esterase/lipase